MAADGLGLLRVSETYLSAAVATVLVLAYAAIVTFGLPAARSPYSAMYLTVVMFGINGVCFSLTAGTPLARRYAGVRRFYKRHGRLMVIGDMQLTMASLAFMWLAVVGII